MVNDPIADLLTRIRNAVERKHKTIITPSSKMLSGIVKILKEEGFINDFDQAEDELKHKVLRIELKYQDGRPAISNIERISKPGLRKYTNYREIPKVLNGLGISIISTPKGVMTGKQAKLEKVGGEYLCNVW